MNETLEAMARALFKSWFVDFDPVRAKAEGRDPGLPKDVANLFSDSFEESELGEIPARWRLGPITELQADRRYACVAGPFGSNLSSRDYVATGVPVLRGSSLSDVSIWIRESGFVFVSDEKANSLMGCLAYPGDIVFTQRGTLGQVSIIPPDSKCSRFLLSQSQMKLAVQSTAAAFYVALYFRQRKIVEYITANGQQAGVPHINLGFLRGFRILLPPLEVLRAFDFVVGPLFRAARARGAESETLAALRDTLLPKLISGELRVKDVERFVEQTSV
jgi:type I restriction enzyme S subunit